MRNGNIIIGINVNRLPGGGSGTSSVLIGLIHALGQLEGRERYLLIGPWQDYDWFRCHTGPNQSIISNIPPENPTSAKTLKSKILKRLFHIMPGTVKNKILKDTVQNKIYSDILVSAKFYESLGIDILHFPTQEYTPCSIPTVYNPHDLQHLHYPQFFTTEEIKRRETVYRMGCNEAAAIVVTSEWIRQDIIKQYQINPEKVQVIPWAIPTDVYRAPTSSLLKEIRLLYKLPEKFIFYPAVTWQHKNHLRLMEAIALLRDRKNLKINLICTGRQHPVFWPQIEKQIELFHLHENIRFLGLIPGEHLRMVYRMAMFVILPTLFEAASGPLFEAWREDTPVACSNVTSLPEQAGDGALLFDPLSTEAIADAIKKMMTEESLRFKLRERGRRRLGDFNWERTAKGYRAVYRRIAGVPLSDEDRHLLEWDWMRFPEQKKENLCE